MPLSPYPQHVPEFEPIPAPRSLPRKGGAILSLGSDERLLHTRAAVLRTTGYEVVSAFPHKAAQLLGSRQFSLGVFGHTLPDRETAELALLLRQRSPKAKLLLTCFDPRPMGLQQLFDSIIDSWTGPVALLRAARLLLGRDGTEAAIKLPH